MYQGQVSNGIKAPTQRPGVIRFAWELFDSAKAHIQPAVATDIAARTGFNLENVQIELRRWKRFHGFQTGRV